MTSIDDYLDKPYAITLTRDRDASGREGWVAAVEELPGSISQGSTPDEAVENVREAMAVWIEAAMAAGSDVPEPRGSTKYSGRFVVRLPESLHAELARWADAEGTSLNQFVVAALAGAVGWRAPQRRPETMPSFVAEYPRRETVRSGQTFVFEGGSRFLGNVVPTNGSAPIEELRLPTRYHNALKGAGIDTVGKLASKRPEEIEGIPSFGKKTVDRLRKTVVERLTGSA
jgi:predicted RNase H-like HicB family nuclease